MQPKAGNRKAALPFNLATQFFFCATLALFGTIASIAHADPISGQSEITATPDAILRLARAARAAGDYSSALNLYRSAADKSGANSALSLEIADTLLEEGSFDDAIQAYTQLKTDAAMRVPALLGLVRAELALGVTDKAIGYADEAQTTAPGDPRVLVARGVTLDSQGKHSDAQTCYRAVLASSPFDLAARNDLALSLALNSKFDEAIDIMTPIARSSNATPQARENLALIYGLKGDHARAMAVSQLDLDDKTAQANLRFFDFVRNGANKP